MIIISSTSNKSHQLHKSQNINKGESLFSFELLNSEFNCLLTEKQTYELLSSKLCMLAGRKWSSALLCLY